MYPKGQYYEYWKTKSSAKQFVNEKVWRNAKYGTFGKYLQFPGIVNNFMIKIVNKSNQIRVRLKCNKMYIYIYIYGTNNSEYLKNGISF